jgi:hypothetical protein
LFFYYIDDCQIEENTFKPKIAALEVELSFLRESEAKSIERISNLEKELANEKSILEQTMQDMKISEKKNGALSEENTCLKNVSREYIREKENLKQELDTKEKELWIIKSEKEGLLKYKELAEKMKTEENVRCETMKVKAKLDENAEIIELREHIDSQNLHISKLTQSEEQSQLREASYQKELNETRTNYAKLDHKYQNAQNEVAMFLAQLENSKETNLKL